MAARCLEPATFVFVEYPLSGSEVAANKRKIRSHVTRLQHKRERDAAQSRCTSPRQDRVRVKHSPIIKTNDSPDEHARLPLPPLPHEGLEVAFSRGSKAFSTFLLSDANADISRCLQALDLDIATVISRWNYVVGFWSRDRHAGSAMRDMTVANGNRFFDLTFRDPVLLTTAMCLAVRNLCASFGTPSTAKRQIAFLALEQHLIAKLNQAIREGLRGVSDHMLVAVALCSTYELIYGSVANYKMHMLGLTQMINLRGGLPGVAESDDFVRDWLIWHDIKTSPRGGQGLFFEKLPGYHTNSPSTTAVA